MRPFAATNYKTPVVHVPRVVIREDGEEVESWPGAGTALLANVGQGMAKGRWTHQVEESTTAWELWFAYTAIVDAEIVIKRGDQFKITPAYGPQIVLRANAHAVDWNQLHVNWYVQAELVS